MRLPWTLIMVTIALAGCATPAEQAARMEREMERVVEIYGPACERLGFKRNEDPWRNCVLRLAQERNYYQYGCYPMGASSCFSSPSMLHYTCF
jgi:hypothetical protein